MLNSVSEETGSKENVKFEYSDSFNVDVSVTEDGNNNFILNVYLNDMKNHIFTIFPQNIIFHYNLY